MAELRPLRGPSLEGTRFSRFSSLRRCWSVTACKRLQRCSTSCTYSACSGPPCTEPNSCCSNCNHATHRTTLKLDPPKHLAVARQARPSSSGSGLNPIKAFFCPRLLAPRTRMRLGAPAKAVQIQLLGQGQLPTSGLQDLLQHRLRMILCQA